MDVASDVCLKQYTQYSVLLNVVQVSVTEATLAGLSILSVTATDRDSGDNGRVTYSLLSPAMDYIRINSTTGPADVNFVQNI